MWPLSAKQSLSSSQPHLEEAERKRQRLLSYHSVCSLPHLDTSKLLLFLANVRYVRCSISPWLFVYHLAGLLNQSREFRENTISMPLSREYELKLGYKLTVLFVKPFRCHCVIKICKHTLRKATSRCIWVNLSLLVLGVILRSTLSPWTSCWYSVSSEPVSPLANAQVATSKHVVFHLFPTSQSKICFSQTGARWRLVSEIVIQVEA